MALEDRELIEIANRNDIRFLFNRFESNNIQKAFMTAHELNQMVEPCLPGNHRKRRYKV